LAETCGSQRLSDLLEGLGGWDGAGSLCPLRAEPVLSQGQVKAEVFDSVLAFFLQTLYPASIKEKEGGSSLLFNPPKLVQQQEVIYILEKCAAVLVS
jgi:hypothetical protein